MTFNDSKFNMWRACIMAIWSDGKVSQEENKWMLEKINSLNFTTEQKEILLNDLKAPANFSEIVEKITDKKDRAFLAHQIRVISHLDGDFSDNEKKLLDSWREFVLKGIDLKALEEIIAQDEKESYHEDEVYKTHNKTSLFEKAHRFSQKVFNPGDYKMPK